MLHEGEVNLDVRDKFSFDDSHVRFVDGHGLGLAVGKEKISAGLVPASPSSVTYEFLFAD